MREVHILEGNGRAKDGAGSEGFAQLAGKEGAKLFSVATVLESRNTGTQTLLALAVPQALAKHLWLGDKADPAGYEVRTSKKAGKRAPKTTRIIIVSAPSENFDPKLRKSWKDEMTHWGVHGDDGEPQYNPDKTELMKVYERLLGTEGFTTADGGASSSEEEVRRLAAEVDRLKKLMKGKPEISTRGGRDDFGPTPRSSTGGGPSKSASSLESILRSRLGNAIPEPNRPGAGGDDEEEDDDDDDEYEEDDDDDDEDDDDDDPAEKPAKPPMGGKKSSKTAVLCRKGCGRPAFRQQPFCCSTCRDSNGGFHTPGCDASHGVGDPEPDDIAAWLWDLTGSLPRGKGKGGGKGGSHTSLHDTTQLEILKILERIQKKSSDDDDFISGGDGDAIGGTELKAFRNLRKLREFIRDHPERIEEDYLERWGETLTEGEDRPWAWTDAQKSISWGNCFTAQKAWVGFSAVLRLLRKRQGTPTKEERQARAQLAQCMKCFEQHALDSGSWVHAWKLSGLEDPREGRRFAGTEEELSVVIAHRKAVVSLETKSSVGRAPGGGYPEGRNNTQPAKTEAERKAAAEQKKKKRDAAAAAKKKAGGAAGAGAPDHP